MAYTPTVWKNGEFPPIDAEHLNKIEQGIADSAPGGFGLGELTGRTANSFSDITGYGFYRVPSESGFAPDTSSNWGAIYIGANLSYGTLVYARLGALMAVRSVSGGEVGPIEWINPPMNLGVEYRTTERYLGKPVYVKLVDCGLPQTNATWATAHGISAVKNIISATAQSGCYIANGIFKGSEGLDGDSMTIATDPINIHISTYGYWSTSEHAIALLKYTKSTD